MKRILAIDRGNTRMKIGLFEGSECTLTRVLENRDELAAFVSDNKVDACCFSDVHGDLESWLEEMATYPISFQQKLPISIAYKNAATLGQDRICNAVAAAAEYPGKDVLVIDAGSCITYDFTDANAVYHGGGISAGWAMRLKAMHHFTGKLPVISNEFPEGDFPYSGTENNMRGATLDGVCFEMEGYIKKIRGQYPNSITLITGGDALALQKALKSDIFADQNLTLKGIFNIYKHQYA